MRKGLGRIVLCFVLLLAGHLCVAQPENGERRPPSIEERIKMVNEKICQPLKLNNTETMKVLGAFKEFFDEMDKIAKPPVRPEKSKVDALAKIRDNKVKQVIRAALYSKYLELELTLRPKEPRDGKP